MKRRDFLGVAGGPAASGPIAVRTQRPERTRRIINVTEVIGAEGDVIITQDLITYEIEGEDEAGKILGRHVGTGIARPAFWDRARYFGLDRELAEALDAAQP